MKKLFILLGTLMLFATPTFASHVSVSVSSHGGGHYYHRYYRPSYGCGHCGYHRHHHRHCRGYYCGYYHSRPYYSHRYYRPRYYSSYTIDLGNLQPTFNLKTNVA